MSNFLAPFARRGAGLHLNIGLGPVADFDQQGLRFDTTGRVYAVLNGEINHRYYSMPYNLHGRLVVGEGSVDYMDQGIPFTATGAIAISSGPVAYWDQGLPFAADGTIVYTETSPPPVIPPDILEFYHDFLTATLGPFIHDRASPATGTDHEGLVFEVADDEPVFIEGLQLEGARTNDALQSNSFLDAAWVKTNVAVNGNQLSASSANGTVIQAAGSGTRAATFDLARVTGTGDISITADNGATWEVVPVTATSQRFEVVASAGTAAPGIRISTSGDVVEAAWGGIETGAFASSRIRTEGTAATRALTSCQASFTDIPELPDAGLVNDVEITVVAQLRFSSAAQTEPYTLAIIGDTTDGFEVIVSGYSVFGRRYISGLYTEAVAYHTGFERGDSLQVDASFMAAGTSITVQAAA